MNSLMEYKGYHAKIEYSADDHAFIGTVCWINDSISFDGASIEEITQAFHESIDDYLDFCNEIGKEPNKEFKGVFNVRVDPVLHRNAALAAAQKGLTLNQFVSEAMSKAISDSLPTQEKRLINLEDSMRQLWMKHEYLADAWKTNAPKYHSSNLYLSQSYATRRPSNAIS